MSNDTPRPKTSPGAAPKGELLFDRENMNRIKSNLACGLETPTERPSASRTKARAARPSAPQKPATMQPMQSIYRKIADEKISMRQGAEVKEVTVREAMARAHIKTAMGGNARALADVTRHFAIADASRAAELAEEQAFWRSYQDVARLQIAEAKHKGEPEPLILPHPDDIVIRGGEDVRFTGPFDAAGLKRQQETRQLRDLMFLWDELDERMRRKQARKGVASPEGAALLFIGIFDRALPQRIRLTKAERYTNDLNARRMTKRELLKALHAGWRALGKQARRGALPPSLEAARKALKSRAGLLNALHSGEVDADKISSGDIDEGTQEVLEQLGFAGWNVDARPLDKGR